VGVSGLMITFFDTGLIGKTMVTVEPSSLTFMGEVEVDRSFTMSGADEVQEHSWIGGETAARNFVERSRSAFQSAGWTSALENVASPPPVD